MSKTQDKTRGDTRSNAELKLIGSAIRDLRKARGYSQRVMSVRVKIDPNYLSRIENGRVNLTVTSLVRIAEALGVHPSALLAPPVCLRSDLALKTCACVAHIIDSRNHVQLDQAHTFLSQVLKVTPKGTVPACTAARGV